MKDDPRPLWRRRLLLPALVLAAVNVLLFGVYTLPRLIRARSLEARRETLSADVHRQQALLDAGRERAETIRDNEADTRRFYQEMMADKNATLLPLLRQLEQAGAELGIEVDRVSYKAEEVRGAPLTRLVITLPVSGQYTELVSFLDQVERLPHFVAVERLAIRGSTGGGRSTGLDLTLSAYFKAEGERDAP